MSKALLHCKKKLILKKAFLIREGLDRSSGLDRSRRIRRHDHRCRKPHLPRNDPRHVVETSGYPRILLTFRRQPVKLGTLNPGNDVG